MSNNNNSFSGNSSLNNIGALDAIYSNVGGAGDTFGDINPQGRGPGLVKREAVSVDPLANPFNSNLSPSPPPPSPPPPSYINGGDQQQQGPYSNVQPPPAFVRPPAVDVVALMTVEFISKCRTNPLDINAIQSQALGIQELAKYNAWKHVMTASSRLVSPDKPGINAGALTVPMKLRLEALFRLKMLDELVLETNKILVAEEKRLTNSYAAMSNVVQRDYACDLSVAMKLLLAEVKSITGRHEEALEQLYLLIEALQTVGFRVANLEYWIWKVRQAIVHAAIRQRNWRIAVREILFMARQLKSKLDELRATTNADELDNRSQVLPQVWRAYIVMLTRISRLFVQVGDMRSGEAYCQAAEEELTKSMEASTTCNNGVSELVALARGILQFTSCQYEEAYAAFSGIIEREKVRQQSHSSDARDVIALFAAGEQIANNSHPHSVGPSSAVDYLTVFDSDDGLVSAAANNLAVCALYLRRVREAVEVLETFIKEDPARHLNDAIVFNLCTLYDLSAAPELSSNKKKVLHRVASAYHVEEPYVIWKSFRLT